MQRRAIPPSTPSRGTPPESEDQIVMQVQRLAAARWDWMHIHSNESWRNIGQHRSSFLEHLPPGDLLGSRIGGFAVPAGQQPPVEPAVMHQQKSVAIRVDDESGTGDVTGRVHMPRERLGDQASSASMSSLLFSPSPSLSQSNCSSNVRTSAICIRVQCRI
jgi:hypothetical protein